MNGGTPLAILRILSSPNRTWIHQQNHNRLEPLEPLELLDLVTLVTLDQVQAYF